MPGIAYFTSLCAISEIENAIRILSHHLNVEI
jgi:hypothetical protein